FVANGGSAGRRPAITFNAGTYTGFRGLIFCKKFDRTGANNYNAIMNAVEPQDLINPDFITDLKALKPKTIRPIGWTGPNDNNIFTQHRIRKNWKTNVGFAIPSWIPNCWAGGPGTAGPNITSGRGGNAFVASAATDTPAAYT